MKKMILVAFISALLIGCGGGGAKIEASTSTQGQQLIDLKKAYDEGIITPKEYEDAKKEILDR